MMVYPPRYNAQEVDRSGFGPCNVNGIGAYSKGIGKGAAFEYCYIILEDKVADEYALDPNMEIVDAATADADMEAWRVANHESEVVITDPDRVRFIQEKKARNAGRVSDGKPAVTEDNLTAEELKALDPDDPMPGLNKRLRPVATIVAEGGQTLTAVEKGAHA
jgi:hypothetical protein